MTTTRDLGLRCECGRVRGVLRGVAPSTTNRAVCYCHDCRAFAHWLDREALLDGRGGADIVQVARARLEITEGRDQLRCMRLTDRGMHRWYAGCCRFPLANTIPVAPFAGVPRQAIEVEIADLEPTFGPILYTNLDGAVGGRPPGARMSLRRLAHVSALLAGWLARGLGQPTPFFDASNRPIVEPEVLGAAEREALRSHPRA